MSQLFYLSPEQIEMIRPFFPLSHGIARVDDVKVVSGIIYVIKHGLQWKDAPREYGPHKTLYNRFIRWSLLGVFNNIFAELAKKVAPLKCSSCGNVAAPDIQTAYENVGRSLSDLCCCCEKSAEQWLPKQVETVKKEKHK